MKLCIDNRSVVVCTIAAALLSIGVAVAQEKSRGVVVTPDTYIRAETDRQFGEIARMAGGVNRFYHFRSPTPLDKQNVVRMNRDTLYSMGVVDTSKGATITIPELPEGRYASVFLVDNDNYHYSANLPLVIGGKSATICRGPKDRPCALAQEFRAWMPPRFVL